MSLDIQFHFHQVQMHPDGLLTPIESDTWVERSEEKFEEEKKESLLQFVN